MGKVQKFEWQCDGYATDESAAGPSRGRCPHTEITIDDQPPPGWNYLYTLTGRNHESRVGRSRTVLCQDCATRLRTAVSQVVRVGGWDHAHTTSEVLP